MITLILFYAATSLAKIWECTPRARIWNKTVHGSCIDIPSLFTASGFFNTMTDFIILLVPIKAVWTLQVSKKRRLGVVLVFTIGFLCVSPDTIFLPHTTVYSLSKNA